MMPFHPLLLLRQRTEAERLAAMVAAAVYAMPAYTDTVADALALLAQRPVGVLILDDRLREGTGIQALARVRQRFATLPVIMISTARSEDVAIDAFHLGVTDYIPKKRGYGDLVVHLVTQLATGTPPTPQTRLLDTPAHIPAALLRPSYENRLRLIGRHCDAVGLRKLALLEAAGGFVVQAVQPPEQSLQVLEFADAHFAHLVSEAISIRGRCALPAPSALLPTGYEDALRAIGHDLDQRRMSRVRLVELERCLLVGGHQPAEGYHESGHSGVEWVLAADDLATLLNEAYYRRDAADTARPVA